MGYSYDNRGRLCCDNCGQAGGVRKRVCPATVRTDSSRGPRLGIRWCSPPAVCSPCWTPELRRKVHGDCREQAQRGQQKYDVDEARLEAGDRMVVSACGDWHKDVPAGMVLVTFAGPYRDGAVQWVDYLMPAADYKQGGWLSEYPTAVPVLERAA